MKSIIITIMLAAISMAGVSYGECGCVHCPRGGEQQPAMQHGVRGGAFHKRHHRKGHRHGWGKQRQDGQGTQKTPNAAQRDKKFQAPKAGCQNAQRQWKRAAFAPNAHRPQGWSKHTGQCQARKHLKLSFGPKGHRHAAVRCQMPSRHKGWQKGWRHGHNHACKAQRPMPFMHKAGVKRVHKH